MGVRTADRTTARGIGAGYLRLLLLPYTGPSVGAAERVDPALPARDLQAARGGGGGDRDGARAAPERLRSLRERDGEEARGPVARPARALPRRRAHRRGRACRARGDPAPPPPGALPRGDARPGRRRRTRRGRSARARALGGAGTANRQGARLSDPRSARGPDPRCGAELARNARQTSALTAVHSRK